MLVRSDDGYVYYTTSESRGSAIKLIQNKIEEDIWYFLELYVTSFKDKISLKFYINSVLVCKTIANSYEDNLIYDENTIGCDIQLDHAGKQGEEKIINNFHGEMTALYFIQCDEESFPKLHYTLMYTLSHTGFEDMINHLESLQNLEISITLYFDIIKEIFMSINPKYIQRSTESNMKVYTALLRTESIDIYNNIRNVHEGTEIHHNMSGRDILLSIGGIESLLPVLYYLGKRNASNKFM